jgi:7-carboxy-7-deazaguanine synthase (Cx14CxxC type)
MTYVVKEIFYTLQGEGANVGRPAVFLRFAGCNLWTGRERDRSKAICKFCDTKFTNGKKYKTASDLVDALQKAWPKDEKKPFVVMTGGEPALQFDKDLQVELEARHFRTAIETNGTVPLKANPMWITVSPKTAELAVTDGDELKFVYPQDELKPEMFADLSFGLFYLQPMAKRFFTSTNTRAALAYCKDHPQWRLSLQTQKLLGIP